MKPDWRLARLRAELKRYDLLRRGVRGLRVLRGRHLADVWRIEAPEARTDKPLSMLFVGEPVTRHYLSGLVYGKYRDAWGRTILPRGALVPGTRLLGRRCDLLVHESAMPAPGALPGGAFWIPNWVGGEIEFAEAERLKKTSGRLQADLRRLRKLPHRVHTTRAPSEIYRFYCEFYEPYIRSTFGACACLSSWEEVEARLPQSELFWIMRDGERLAGQIVLYEPERVRAWCLGVKSGARELVRAGVIAALYQAESSTWPETGTRGCTSARHARSSRTASCASSASGECGSWITAIAVCCSPCGGRANRCAHSWRGTRSYPWARTGRCRRARSWAGRVPANRGNPTASCCPPSSAVRFSTSWRTAGRSNGKAWRRQPRARGKRYVWNRGMH